MKRRLSQRAVGMITDVRLPTEVLNRQPAVTSVLGRTSVIIPTALWLSLRYTPALETLNLKEAPPSPADGLVSYPVARRTTKLTQLMPRDRPSARDRRGDCQRLLNRPRRDVRKAVLRDPDSALLPGPSPIGAARGVDGGTRPGRLPPSTPWTRCVLQTFCSGPRPGRVRTF